MRLTRVLCSALPLLAALSQDWGLQGGWELVSPTNLGPALAYRGATSSTGTFVVTANDTDGADGGTIGATRAYSYDIFANAWRAWPDLPGAGAADPFSLDVGGQVFVVDETNLNNMFFIDSSAARARIGQTWTVPAVTGGPVGRFGMRVAAFGPILYSFGGVDMATGVTHNDLYAIGAGTIISGQTQPPPAWSQVAPDGLAGFPPGRVGYNLFTFGTVIILFGGVNVLPSAPTGTLPDVCFSTATSNLCEFHHHVWAFRPGNPGPPSEITVTGAQWSLLSGGSGAAPAGRFDATGGALGDQFFIYGGTTAAGPSAELWAFNLVSQTFGLVAPSSPAPSAATDLGYGLGALIGRHIYHYAQPIATNGMPIPGGGQLWRWAPSASSGGPPAAAAAACAASAAVVNGHTAGMAISVLLLVVVTALTAMTAQALGVVPACGLPGCPPRGAPSIGPAGFYSSSSKSAISGGYVAPSDAI